MLQEILAPTNPHMLSYLDGKTRESADDWRWAPAGLFCRLLCDLAKPQTSPLETCREELQEVLEEMRKLQMVDGSSSV